MAARQPIKRGTELEYQDWQNVVNAAGDRDDLRCAILICASIEQALGTLLCGAFCSDAESVDEILNRTLGGLTPRADLAYCLRLISKETRNRIRSIGAIRNLFAHYPLPRTFGDERVVIACNRLPKPDKTEGVKFHGQKNESTTPQQQARTRFLLIAMPIAHQLLQSGYRP
jgi:hypothetical protein